MDEEEEDSEFIGEEHKPAPTFGDSETPWEQVREFYNYWKNFVSKRSFSWCDKYKPNTAPNRKVKRLMEKENKKERDKAKKARNEQIRHLAEFVYKRDKRVLAYQKLKKQEEEEKKRQKEQKKKELEEIRKKEKEKLHAESVAYMEKFIEEFDIEEIESVYGNQDQEELSDEDKDSLLCVACQKQFKTPNQLQNHQKSKSHKEKIDLIRQSVLLDEEKEELDNNTSHQVTENSNEEEVHVDISKAREKWKKKQRKKMKMKKSLFQEVEEIDDSITTKNLQKNDENPEIEENLEKQEHLDNEQEKEEKREQQQEEEKENEQKVQDNKKNKKKKKKGQKKKEKEDSLICNVCQTQFESRNQLFKHIKQTGHARAV